MSKSIIDYLKEVPDPRGAQGSRDDLSYIQQVFWAKKYLPRKSEGFRDPILNSKFFVEN